MDANNYKRSPDDTRPDWQVIEDAADIAERRGVCYANLHDEATGQVCADGALIETLFGTTVMVSIQKFPGGNKIYKNPELDRVCGRIAEALDLPREGGRINGNIGRVYRWNDRVVGVFPGDIPPEYKHHDVLDGLRLAAKKVRLVEEGIEED